MANKHEGSGFDDWLEEEGILEEVTARAVKKVLTFELEAAMKKKRANMGEILAYTDIWPKNFHLS